MFTNERNFGGLVGDLVSVQAGGCEVYMGWMNFFSFQRSSVNHMKNPFSAEMNTLML